MMAIYKVYGFEKAISKVTEIFNASRKAGKKVGDPMKAGQMRGELAEILLEIHLLEYCKTHKQCFYVKGLCVTKSNNRGASPYTEMDLVFCTPEMVYMFECKSYSGRKQLVNECTIVRERYHSMDVYGQNLMHTDALDAHISKNKLCGREDVPYTLVLFSMSEDETKDLREPCWKKTIPLVDEKTIQNYLWEQASTGRVWWNIKGLLADCQKLNVDSDSNKKRHVAYLTKSKSKRKS